MEDIPLLMVDGDTLTVGGLSDPLQKDGFEVTAVRQGSEALELIDARTFSLILTELVLPDMSGLDILRFAKAKDADTMVVFFTAYGDPDSIISALRSEADDYIIKPVAYRDLSFRIGRVFRKQQLQIQNKVLRREVAKRNQELIELNTDLMREIDDRRAAEERIRRALEEKEVLLREIHHRVKNNLAMVASLINLKSAQQEDPGTLAVFNELKQRIRAIHMVHEKIYRGSDIATLNYGEYLRELVSDCIASLDTQGRAIDFRLEAPPLAFDLDTSIPLGLAVVELASNSIKHAFAGEGGVIDITITVNQGDCEVEYRDSGPGIPPERLESVQTLGLNLVAGLARQLGGRMEPTGNGGVRIRFPLKEKPE